MNWFSLTGMGYVEVATLVIFCVTYIGLAVGHWFFLKLDRTGIALLGGIAMLAFGCLKLPQAIASVNMQSILLLFALMVIASQLRYAGFYCWVTEKILKSLLNRPALFLGVLMALGGGLSAFLNNDVVVLAVSPVITMSLLEKKLNPVPFLIALALSSNIGCALTTIGNAQNVLIGEMGRISFGAYMTFAAVPVVLSLAVCYVLIYWIGRNSFVLKKQQQQAEIPPESIPFHRWRTIKGTGILLILVILFVFTNLPHYLVAMTGAGLLLCSHMLPSRNVLQGVNWQLLVLFIGLFVVVGAFVDCGLSDDMLAFLNRYGVDLNQPIQLALISGILSNCINNSAAVMLLVKVVDLSLPMNCYALALSNAFAGNLIIIGSLANVIVVQCAENYRLEISFREFLKYGVPTALSSMGILIGWLWIF